MIYEEVPVGAKIIAVLDIMSAILCFYLAFLFFTNGELVNFLYTNFSVFETFGENFYLTGGILLCITGLFVFLLGKGLWQGHNWARYIEITLAVIGFITALVYIFFGQLYAIFNLIVHGIVGLYLLFNEKVKEAFY